MSDRQQESESIFTNLSSQIADEGGRRLLANMRDAVVSAEVELAAAQQREAVLELASGLMAELCREVLEWYHSDDDLMPQNLVDQLTAEAARLLPPHIEEPPSE